MATFKGRSATKKKGTKGEFQTHPFLIAADYAG
jgi:hypothetical protein